jgi:hypothetical protein
MRKKRVKKSEKQDSMGKKNFFLLHPALQPLDKAPQKYSKNGLNTHFQQKFAMGSYGVGIRRAWYSWKACEICSSLV